MASADLNELFNAALRFARRMLGEFGEFRPFGVSMGRDGRVAVVAGEGGGQCPLPSEVVQLLQSMFRAEAADGKLRAAGVCADVRVVPPGDSCKSEAICVRLAHLSGEAVEVFVPYRCDALDGYSYGDSFATCGEAFSLRDMKQA
jgi:hypothetical protein